MPDILIRDVPAHVVKRIDNAASGARLSRNEYMRRKLANEVGLPEERHVTMEDLRRFAETHQDLKDPDVMAQAWS